MNWFERLTGFNETTPDQVRRKLRIEGENLCSLANGRSYRRDPRGLRRASWRSSAPPRSMYINHVH